MGYHKQVIRKGILGDFSKVEEEIQELQDAKAQGAKILILCELSDLYGAINHYLKKHHNLEMEDIKKMSELTEEAFKDGSRK